MIKCILCDQEVLPSDNQVHGIRTGDVCHASCYQTWLVEQIKGNDI